jgi:hypothetical protein
LTEGVTTLDSLLTFIGYPLTGAQLESTDPAVLMSPQRAAAAINGLSVLGMNGATLREGDIIATRFFAPKIANVNIAPPVPGWRKLVRLRVRPNSSAVRVGIESVIILFNYLSAQRNPFSGRSINTQVMLIAPVREERLYWMDFDPEGKLSLALNASFDAADLPDGRNQNYFVPDGCNTCHGSIGNLTPPMVNYLDTDHWFDRLNDDFAAVKAADMPIIFDAQTNDTSQSAFKEAFDVIRRFNEEALFQNNSVQAESFETEAARTWLKIHANSDQHFPPVARAFSINSAPTWQASEAVGLGKLNRYCFRCHGTVRFSVFDRSAVVDVERLGNILQRIRPGEQQKNIKMPPDRNLNKDELEALEDFLNSLQ